MRGVLGDVIVVRRHFWCVVRFDWMGLVAVIIAFSVLVVCFDFSLAKEMRCLLFVWPLLLICEVMIKRVGVLVVWAGGGGNWRGVVVVVCCLLVFFLNKYQ